MAESIEPRRAATRSPRRVAQKAASVAGILDQSEIVKDAAAQGGDPDAIAEAVVTKLGEALRLTT